MTYQSVPFSPVGASYQSRSKPLSSQQTVNWYQQYNDEGKEPFVLMPFPGLKQFGTFDTELSDRGFWRMAEVLYQVKGTSLYLISATGAHVLLGVIPGSNRCIFSGDGINLVIVADLRTFVYATDTGVLSESTVTGVTGAKSVDIINNQFLFTNDNTTFVANLDNVTKLFTTDGQIAAESKPDNLVRDFVFDERIHRFGNRTTEAWYNNPNVIPPISRLEGQILEVGCVAINSIAATDEAMYWLGDDNAIYRSRSGVKERVSTDAISNSISKCEHLQDAYAYTFTMEGQNFYVINFCPDNLTFVLNESLGLKGWFELSSGIDGDRYQGSSLMNVYGKNIVADETNGKVYELDFDTYVNDVSPIKRTRITRSIDGNLIGRKGERVQMSKFEFIMETGTGLISGQGEDPRIMIEASYDGGRTWNHTSWPRVGRLGEYTLKVEWYKLHSFYDCILRITTTDPVNYSIFGGVVDLKLGGK